jgi:hypothetical protein
MTREHPTPFDLTVIVCNPLNRAAPQLPERRCSSRNSRTSTSPVRCAPRTASHVTLPSTASASDADGRAAPLWRASSRPLPVRAASSTRDHRAVSGGPELGCAPWLVEPASPGRGVLVDVPSSLAPRYSRSDRGGKASTLPAASALRRENIRVAKSRALCRDRDRVRSLRENGLRAVPALVVAVHSRSCCTWHLGRRRRSSNGESPGRGPRHSRRAPRCGNHRHQPPHEQISSATVPHEGAERKGASHIAQPRPAAAESPLPATAQRRSYPGITRDGRDSGLRWRSCGSECAFGALMMRHG